MPGLQKTPDGKMDKQFIFAAEKIFPSLDKGDIGVRGSLGAGDREFKQAALGLSYKIARIQFDYGFSLPIGTVKETSGNHKLALTYHFGAATQTELAETELLDQYKRLREAQNYKSPRDIASLNDPRLAEVKEQVDKENYYEAGKLILEKANELLPDPRLSTYAPPFHRGGLLPRAGGGGQEEAVLGRAALRRSEEPYLRQRHARHEAAGLRG